jgi:hypothetical protein
MTIVVFVNNMSVRKILIVFLILATLVVPFVQLSIGFYYVTSIELCPLQNDLMLLMAIGGVFEAIFFAVTFAFVFSITPARYKTDKKLTEAEITAKGSNRASQFIIGASMCIFATCAIIFFVLIQVRVYGNYKKVQWKTPTGQYYCLFTIFSSAFGLIIATYVSFILLFIVTIILLFGIGI